MIKKLEKKYFIKNGWSFQNNENCTYKIFKFKNFTAAFSWMTEVAFAAEKSDHHPDWKNIYNTVEVTLSTHDIGTLSNKDLELAKLMDELYEKFI